MTTTETRPDDRITATERRELRSAVRAQMKALRAEVTSREADMASEMERRLAERYREDDKQADAFRRDLKKITEKADVQLDKLKEKYEALFSGGQWSADRKFNVPYLYRRNEDRNQLREALKAGIRAELQAARAGIDRQEAALLRELAVDALRTSAAFAFLEAMPKTTGIVPAAKVQEIEAQYRANHPQESTNQ